MIEDIRLSIKGIWSHKMRSFLTMLGIIVGVAAVIAVVSTINGTNEQIKNNLVGDGTNTVNVELYEDGWPADFTYSQIPAGIPEFDQEILKKMKDIDGVRNASLLHQRVSGTQIFHENTELSGNSVYGIDSSYLDTACMQVIMGRGFSEKEYTGYSKVVLIDRSVMSSAFGSKNPLGKTLDIAGEPFVVIGVVDKMSQFEPVITSVADYNTYAGSRQGAIYIPDGTWPILFQYDEPRNLILRAESVDDMTSVGKEAAQYLNSFITVPEESKISYQSTNLAEAAADIQQLSSSANILMIGIASISLLVGGIGVMNIMLVSVTERTREIGLKKAIGARKSRIRRQFLTEAVMLSGIGGILGVLAGILLSRLISVVASIPAAVSPLSIIIAVVFSMVIGIAFGMIPSMKASNLNPIEALHYE